MLESTSIIPREFQEMSRKVAVIESNYVTRDYLDERIDRVSTELHALAQRVAYIEANYMTKQDLESAIRGLTWRIYSVISASIIANYVIVRHLLP